METLNHYLNLAAGVVIGWDGTLDKFMGDGLMAIFNAPNPLEDHVHRATEAALAMMHAAHEVNVQHGYKLSYSIGVNVGDAVVGYIGNKDAMNYTAIGDTINLAKRLQEYAKPGQILIDHAVVQRLGKLVKARPLGKMRVKGRQQPTIAYELLDLKPLR
jgi:adenylate cyclase